jgi:hypothetical protein
VGRFSGVVAVNRHSGRTGEDVDDQRPEHGSRERSLELLSKALTGAKASWSLSRPEFPLRSDSLLLKVQNNVIQPCPKSPITPD